MEYKNRLIDQKLERYLNVFGAISIEGPKWCGKTSTGEHFAQDKVYFSNKQVRDLAKDNINNVLNEIYPTLIDEWQLVPSVWDEIRNKCDSNKIKGGYILTGSSTLRFDDTENEVFHSGAGRFALLKMYTMSLYESGDSTGDVSIIDMYNNKNISKNLKEINIKDIAQLIIRGGWPENINIDTGNQDLIPKEYIKVLLETDIHKGKRKIDSKKMNMVLRSLARNESTISGNDTIVKDISENETKDIIKDRETVKNYISALEDLYLISNQEAFSINYRSSKRIGKSFKRHLIDPSLSCALLNLSVDKLMNDFNTFGFMFEALVERDLKIYMDYLNGNLYHFRDNQSGDEVDAILEFEDGEYAAIEIKLSHYLIDEAKKSLLKFYDKVEKKPKFMCIIVSNYISACKDKETGIYILPITALKP